MSHWLQTVAPDVLEYVPGLHFRHPLPPALYWPAGHELQEEEPVLLVNEPTPQLLQFAESAVLENCPMPHNEQEYWVSIELPALHAHRSDPVPTVNALLSQPAQAMADALE